MSETFSKGDVVIMRSGGPKMTVADTGDYGPLGPGSGIRCQWFDGNARMEEVFDADTLERYEPRSPYRRIG